MALFREPRMIQDFSRWGSNVFSPGSNPSVFDFDITPPEMIKLVGGRIFRIPTKKEIRANLSQGGIAQKCSINQRDKYICKQIKPWLKKNGLFFAGIDIIGKYLTEINVTSPTGIVEINQLENKNLEKIFWDIIEKKLKNGS